MWRVRKPGVFSNHSEFVISRRQKSLRDLNTQLDDEFVEGHPDLRGKEVSKITGRDTGGLGHIRYSQPAAVMINDVLDRPADRRAEGYLRFHRLSNIVNDSFCVSLLTAVRQNATSWQPIPHDSE